MGTSEVRWRRRMRLLPRQRPLDDIPSGLCLLGRMA